MFKLQDKKAKQLLSEVKKMDFPKAQKIENEEKESPSIWKYSKPFDEGAFVPRVVIEKEGEYVIDICVDIRGYQFVILKRDNDVNEDDVKHLLKEFEYDVKQFDDPTEKNDKRVDNP